MYGKDRFGKAGPIERLKTKVRLISYDFIEVDNEFMQGNAFKCKFKDDLIGEYTMYYSELESFLKAVKGTTKDEKILRMLQKAKENPKSEKLKRKLIKIK